MTTTQIKELAKMLNVSIPIIVAFIVFGLCVLNIDKLLLILSSIQKLFTSVSSSARKGVIANSIRGHLLKASKAFHKIGEDVLVSDLRIEWVKEQTPEAFINNGQVILRMAQSANPHINYVNAVNAYVGSALLSKSKPYLDEKVLKMSKICTSRMLVLNGNERALGYFDDNILNPIIDNDEDAKEIFERLRTIDKNGMFVNILLNEYAKATNKIYPDNPDPLLNAESKELLYYLHNIALGNQTSYDDLRFQREYFKVEIFLTAKTKTYNRSGKSPYIKHICEAIERGAETIYVFGLGKKIDIAKEIAESVGESDYRIKNIIPHYYRHKSVNNSRIVQGLCYEIEVFQNDCY